MPGFIVDVSSTVQCKHMTAALPTAPFPRVTVSNQAVVQMAAPWSIAGCPGVPTNIPPCTSVVWATGSTRVLAGGQPLVLQDSQSTCPPNPFPATITLTQLRVKAT